MKYQIDWFESEKVVEGLGLPINQLYCWTYASDNKIALVSKDNEKWQFPGGKPKENEIDTETLERELNEEISLRLNQFQATPKMFGYYIVTESEDDGTLIKKYLQLRYFVKLSSKSEGIGIAPNENKDEIGNDEVKYSKWFTIDEAKQLISWLSGSKELVSFTKIGSNSHRLLESRSSMP